MYASSHPDWCVQVGVEFRRSTCHHTLCGGSANETIRDSNRSAQDRNFHGNIRMVWYPELFECGGPFLIPPLPARRSDNSIGKIRSDIVRDLKTMEQGGTGCNGRLQDHAASFFVRGVRLLNLGGQTQFRVCSACSCYECVILRVGASCQTLTAVEHILRVKPGHNPRYASSQGQTRDTVEDWVRF